MRTQRFTAIIENNIRAIIIFISKYTSYVLGVTLFSAGIGGVTASLFALYFFDAVKVELSSYFMILLKICIFTVWTGSAYQFGLFYRLGLKGAYGKTLKTIHKFIEYRNRNIIIKENLQDEEYKELFKALIRFPKNIALTINIGITLILIGLLTFEISLEGLQLQKTLIILSVAFIAIFIVTCFSMVISEILTGELRAKCMEIMYEKNISIDKLREDAIYTVRTKLTYFIILFIINLLISNSITYSNRGNLNKVYSFSFLAVTASLFMAFLIFYIIYSALKQIESATYDLMKGGKGQLFLKTIDSEFVNLANGVNLAASTIREYQQNLENKVEERTMELNKSLGELARKDRMLATELDFAANIQKGILPLEEDLEPWNGISFATYYKAMGKVSGDYYDVYRYPSSLYVLLADASGHGVPAALVTMAAKQAFSNAIEENIQPSEVFKEVNEILCSKIKTSDYLTAFLLRISENNRMEYANASHTKAIHFIHSKKEFQLLDTNGIFIGALEDAGSTYESRHTRLQSGDRVYLYTDGLIEHKNPEKEEYGQDRLIKMLFDTQSLNLQDQVYAVINDLERFMKNAEVKDDISVFAIELQPNWSKFIELYNSGIHLLRLNKVRDALFNFAEAKKLIPSYAGIKYQLALVYYQMNELDKSKLLIEDFLTDKPKDKKGIQLAINIFMKTGEKERARNLANELKELA